MHLSFSLLLCFLIHSLSCLVVSKEDLSFLSEKIAPIAKDSLNQVSKNLTHEYSKMNHGNLHKRSFSFIGTYVSKTLVNPTIKSFEGMLNQSLQLGYDRYQNHLKQASKKRGILSKRDKLNIANYHADLIAKDIENNVNAGAQSQTDAWTNHHVGLFQKKANKMRKKYLEKRDFYGPMGMQPPPMGIQPPMGGAMIPYQDTPMNPYSPITWPISYLIGFLLYKVLLDLTLFRTITGFAFAATQVTGAFVPALAIYIWVFQPIVNKLLTGFWQPFSL